MSVSLFFLQKSLTKCPFLFQLRLAKDVRIIAFTNWDFRWRILSLLHFQLSYIDFNRPNSPSNILLANNRSSDVNPATNTINTIPSLPASITSCVLVTSPIHTPVHDNVEEVGPSAVRPPPASCLLLGVVNSPPGVPRWSPTSVRRRIRGRRYHHHHRRPGPHLSQD